MNRIKAACHVHSDWSYDGKWPLEKIAAVFAGKGYRVVMMTEHDRGFDEARRQSHREACRKATNENILIMPGIEYSDPTNTHHFLTWGDVPFIGEGMEVEMILSSAKKAGGLVVYAHPSRRDAWKLFRREWTDRLLGIEMWNRKTDGWAPSLPAMELIRTTGAVAFAGLDFHSEKQFFPLAMELELEGAPTEANVLAALAAKRCRPMAFGGPAPASGKGLRGGMLRAGESCRRTASRIYKTVLAPGRIK